MGQVTTRRQPPEDGTNNENETSLASWTRQILKRRFIGGIVCWLLAAPRKGLRDPWG